jgi:hypothetical protein
MTRNLNSILSKPDAARLRAAYGCPPDMYPQLIEMLSIEISDYDQFGVLSLQTGLILTEAQMATVGSIEIKGYLNDFLIITVSPKLRTALKKGIGVIQEDPDFLDMPRLTKTDDPYLRTFDELGDIAESVPRYADEPDYAHWGEQVFLMTETRLTQELKNGDLLRLLHRTRYRPIE